MVTARTEEYLEAIFKLQEETDKPVGITKVAEYLKLSAASASEMVKRLKQDGTVNYDRKREISLTKKGWLQASRVIRRHRLAERLLTDYLKLNWDKVHEEACKLEHAISAEVEGRLAESLGNPSTCPHGYPIPNEAGEYPKIKVLPLLDLKMSNQALIARIREERADVLKYLDGLGIKPGAKIRLLEIAPFGGPISIEVNGERQALGRELAGLIMVKKRSR